MATVQVLLDAVELEVEDLEDVLVTDPLFVDYLNHYLALPIFPEKIQFNPKSGAFEIDDNSSRQLTDKLRALIRSQRTPPPIYRPAREHSYRDIPLINVEGDSGPQPQEIDTTLQVKVLNREQGVGWIKKERFSLFLKSDCYLQYRLAKIIAQARLKDESGKAVSMVTLPSRPPSRRTPKDADLIHADPSERDEHLLERCFVSLGQTSTTATDAWVAQSLRAHQTTLTGARGAPIPAPTVRPISARPQTSLSVLDQSRLSVDSGFCSPTKSLGGMSLYGDRDSALSRPITPGRPAESVRPITPRPTDSVCVIGPSMVNSVQSPVHIKNTESAESVTEEAEKPEPKSFRCEDADQLASVITGTVLKYSIAEVTGKEVAEVAKTPEVKQILPDGGFEELSLEDLGRMSVEPREAEPRQPFTPTPEKDAEKSDEDPLDSDDEFDDDRDRLFRRKLVATPVGSLGRLRAVEDFRAFLRGTAGEVLWNLWVDIDRICVGTTNDEINSALATLRSKYSHHQGASSGVLQVLRDWESRQWTVDALTRLQRDIAKRLLLYWTPRYLMAAPRLPRRQLYNINDRWNVTISGRRAPRDPDSYPDPKVKTPLPLRPKTCLPRKNRIDVTARPCAKTQEHPSIGYKRVYAPPSLQFAFGHVPRIEDLVNRETGGERLGSASRRTRAQSARSATRPGSARSVESEFLGGRRLERLLQALARESLSGSFFRRFADKSGNVLWQNSIKFWTDLQQYHDLFYSQIFDRFRIDRVAKHIYSVYIVEGSRHDLGCSPRVRRQIHSELEPPFEELFDAAEEHALTSLHDAWRAMIQDDAVGFAKVEQVEVSRSFHTKNKEFLAIQAKGLFKQAKKEEESEGESDEESMEDYQDPVYDPSLILNVKEEFRGMTLDKLTSNRIELEYFRQFLAEHYASMDLLCWMDIEAFRRIPHSEEAARDAKAKLIRTKYLCKKYFFGPNSPAGKDSQNKVMEIGGGYGKLLDERPPTQVLLEVQKYVRDRLEKKWLPLFLSTEEFADRQNPAVRMDEVVDDVLVQRRKQSAAVTKMLESKWVSSSKEIISFRKALLNPVTSSHFRKYVSLRGEHLENDVLFWREVQAFKQMYHLHNEEANIQSKITNIIQCFIDSSIPPSLQIDIRSEQADKIIDKRRELGPYIFREAQLTVFRVLVPFWNEFCEYRKGISDASLADKLEKQKRRQKAKARRQAASDKESSKKSTARSGSSTGSAQSGGDEVDGEEAQPEEQEGKNKVSWTYSQYLDCLKREEDLNTSEYSSQISMLA